MGTTSRIRIGILLLLLALGVYFVSRVFSPSAPVEIAEGSTLVLELGGGYVEAAAASPLARLAGDDTRPFLGLLSMFRVAERDDRISTVVLRIAPMKIGWGKADEIREAIARLRAKGKHTVAHLEIANFSANRELFIASAANEIYVSPGSALPLVGLAAEYLFLGGFWEKLGIEFDVAKAGRYKSAVEVYSERTMSDASREMANSLLDDTYRRFVEALASGRQLTTAAVLEAINLGSVRSQRLEALGLIDGEQHLDQLLEAYGEVVTHSDYQRVDPGDIGFDAKAEIALIYGSGTVVQGEAGNSPLSSAPVFASETISRAIIEAAEDPDMAAIVLRIDSPGGSALASELIWRAAQRARALGKPVIASFSDVAASGGYYVASAADAIVSNPGTLTGSIGVFALRPALGGLLDKLDIGVEWLTRGRHADFLLSSEKMSPAALARLQTSVLDTYQLFLTRVAEGRGLSREQVDEVGQGRVWTGAQALEAGLIDELGGIYTAVRRAKEAIGLSADDDVYLVPFPARKTLGEQLMQVFQLTAIRVSGSGFEWPAPLDQLQAWTRNLPSQTPLLIPPIMVEIR
ncbi:MAG: signal peptide peptidase SppA [Deltaproteobacteria bacterium]|nr:signal peptide peptidase SppA [Deltaproteobacteria bacterium]